MKERLEKTISFKYHITCDQGLEIPEKHKGEIQEDVEKRVYSMFKDGYTQGELFTSVRFGKDIVPEEDEENGLSYSGWWYSDIDVN